MPGTKQNQIASIDEIEAEDAAFNEKQRIAEVVKGIASRLEAQATEIVGKKRDVEDIWYENTRQYFGRYDETTEANLKTSKTSRLFVHMTRPKTDLWVARLFDLLFPTDEKNWGIMPTPVPEIQAAIDTEPKVNAGDDVSEDQAMDMNKAAAGRDHVDTAAKAATAMQREMEDQLVQSKYAAECRDVIENMCRLGTGILKGPIDGGAANKRWALVGSIYQLKSYQDSSPHYVSVDPWNFFPDPNATRMDDAEFTYERHLWTKKKLKGQAARLGFDMAAVNELLKEGPNTPIPDFISNIRAITHQNKSSIENRFVIWEYRGPIETNELRDLLLHSGDEAGLEAMKDDLDELFEIEVVVYVCQGKVLKFGIHPLDRGDTLYSAVSFAKDNTSIWGYGVPALMSDSQKALNAAWRMMMDNGGLSAGPQVLINKKVVEPVDGDWTLRARKVWRIKDDSPNGAEPFAIFNVDSNQAELGNIINLSREFIDDEVSLPAPTQGETAGAQVGNTVGGLAMIMNSSNIIFRRVVRNFDDDLTVPSLHRLYDWNMQFSDKDEIKGDMQVEARGSSVLLTRELQAQNIMALLQTSAADPEFAAWVKKDEALKSFIESLMLSSKKLLRTEEEMKQFLAENQPTEAEGQQVSPEEIKFAIVQFEAESRERVEAMRQETELIKLAEAHEMKLEELQAKLQIQRDKQDSDERKMSAEAGFKMRMAQREAAGTAVEVGGTSFGAAI